MFEVFTTTIRSRLANYPVDTSSTSHCLLCFYKVLSFRYKTIIK